MEFLIHEVFEITGRGAVVVIEEIKDFKIQRPHFVEIKNKKGDIITCKAYQEFILRRNPTLREQEAFMLEGVHKEDIAKESTLRFLEM